jgi:hypothetical protein
VAIAEIPTALAPCESSAGFRAARMMTAWPASRIENSSTETSEAMHLPLPRKHNLPRWRRIVPRILFRPTMRIVGGSVSNGSDRYALRDGGLSRSDADVGPESVTVVVTGAVSAP